MFRSKRNILKFVIEQLLLLIKKSLFAGAWLIPAVAVLMIVVTWVNGDFGFLSALGLNIRDFSCDEVCMLDWLLYLSLIGAVCLDIVKWLFKRFFRKELLLGRKFSILLTLAVITIVYIVLLLSIFSMQGFDMGMFIFILILSSINYVYLFLYGVVICFEYVLERVGVFQL